MKNIRKQLIILSIILSITLSYFQQNYIFAEENGVETQINLTYQEDSKTRGESYANALIAVIKADGRKIKINYRNVCPHIITNVKIEIVIAAWTNDHSKITSYTARPIYIGSVTPGTGSSVTYTIPAPLAYPIQAETCVSGIVKGQNTIGYGVVTFKQ